MNDQSAQSHLTLSGIWDDVVVGVSSLGDALLVVIFPILLQVVLYG